MTIGKFILPAVAFSWLFASSVLTPQMARGEWQEHRIRQGDGKTGHIGAVALPDGHIVSAYGHYQLGAAVLIKWKLDAEPAVAVPRVGVQIGPKANDLQRYAADELAGYLGKLFRIEARPAVQRPESADVLLLVGAPGTNPAVAKALGKEAWPKVSDQGIVLKKTSLDGKPALIVGGGSDAATLWAVYELVERWGVRYLLHGDVLPQTPATFRLPDADVVLEPNLRVRQWRTVNDFACGPESWGLAEHRRVIDQLAKLRFNRIFVNVYPYQPFLDLEIKGVRRKSATLWYDFQYPITPDMPGRSLFGKEAEFWNPDLPPRGAGYQDLAAARRARASSSLQGQSLVDYWIGRLQFGVGYFDTVRAFRRAARADADGQRAETLRHAEAALKHTREALEAYARVARDQSDRGAIATMAEYVYRPLKVKVAQLQKQVGQRSQTP